MTSKEFNEIVRNYVRNYVAENDKFYRKEFEDVFEDIIEDVLNEPVCEGIEMGQDDLSHRLAEYDYCDAHEEEWKIEGKWGTRG